MLHIVESLDSGAVENWLLRMLRAARRFDAPVDWTFYTVLERPGKHDDLARSLGATVIHSPVALRHAFRFVRELRRTIAEGHYDVLHAHHDVVSTVYLVAALGLPLRKRIVHVHNADLGVPTPNPIKVFIAREPMRRLAIALADSVVGISRHTLSHFLRGREPRPGSDVVVYYGVDTECFRNGGFDRESIRKSVGIERSDKVILFASRMVSYKNPLFVLEMLAPLAATIPNVVAVFAGSGPLEQETRRVAAARGLADRVRILGWRDDTIDLMRAADLLVFPRIDRPTSEVGLEGLGLVVVEAQAAGLPILVSPGIPEDALVVPALCTVLPLAAGPRRWAEAARDILSRPRLADADALARVESSPFSLENGFRSLIALYRTAVA